MFIQIFFNRDRLEALASQAGRSVDVKRALYARIAENLGAAGVRGDDILINLVEMPKENRSFGEVNSAIHPPRLEPAMEVANLAGGFVR